VINLNKKLAFFSLLSFLALVSVLPSVKATTIPSATLDKDEYLAGETGSVAVSVYNDENDVIRVTEVSASVNYYYEDGTVYVQKFFSSAVLPDNITVGQTKTYNISISLPTNIAHGYLNPVVEVKTDLWYASSSRWTTWEHPTYPLKLHVQSPYKQLYEDSQNEVASIEDQLADTKQELQNTGNKLKEEQLLTNTLNSNVMMLAATTMVSATVAAFLGFYVFSKRPKAASQA
jgi:hypothetical protein